MRVLLLGVCVVLTAAVPARADEAAAVDFNRAVAPLLKKYCVGCHNARDREGDLLLETSAQVLADGPSGPLVVPGKADESRLIGVLIGRDEPSMPPEDNPRPSEQEIAALASWINAGAKPPAKETLNERPATPHIKPTVPVREAITDLAFAPDGKSLALARFDSIEILSYPERRPLRTLGPQRGRINAVRYSADGMQLLAAGGDPGISGEARLWNVSSGEAALELAGHDDSLYAAILSPDGKLLATSSYDQSIKLWDAATGRELRTLDGHNDAVFGLAFRPDGKVLASASGDRTVKLWDVGTGERLDTLGQPTKEQYCVAFSPDGTQVAAGGADNRIRIWQVSTAAAENTNPLLHARFAYEGAVVNLVYSADGQTMVSAGEDRTVKIWDAEQLSERLLLERQSDWAPALAISPDANVVVLGRLDGSLAVYDARSGDLIPPPPPPQPELASLSMRGAQIGTTTRLTLHGKHLDDAGVRASTDKLAVALVEASSDKLLVDLAADESLLPGPQHLWVAGPGGESKKLPLYLEQLPQSREVEPNDALQRATPIDLESSVWGVLAAKGDVDTFAFDARAGQSLVLEITAASIGSKANAVLTVCDAAGRVLADNNDFGGSLDPLLTFEVPADGRYVVIVSDLTHEGSGEHFYRLSIGEFQVPVAVYPLGVPAGRETSVTLVGPNIAPQTHVQVPVAEKSGEVELSLDRRRYRLRKPLKVVVAAGDEPLEVEPNDTPQQATPLAVPGTINGRIYAPEAATDDDYYRFESRAGQQWIIETEAARRGSPVDTVVEVLDADGKSIERVLLQAVRDSTVTFRGIDGNTRDCRLTNWEEMQLNQYVYLNGEVVRLFRAPRGPDSGFLFYEGDGGKRLLYFDTTATVHAVDEPCYIVEPHPPGTQLISTGLPVFPLYYVNDDDAERRLGSDSRLTFTAPADGAYLIHVRDARGHQGPDFAYRLTVREPVPNFVVSVHGGDKTAAESGAQFTLVVDRIDGFDDAVEVTISNLPDGFRASSPVVIEPGHREAYGVLFAEPGAKQPTAEQLKQIKVQAKATVAGTEVLKPVAAFDKLQLQEKPKLLVRLEPAELVIAPGSTITATLRVERNGHDDLIKFEVQDLPHGVIVDNIGLSGVLMPKGESERQIFLTADAWVGETTRQCFAIEQQAGGQCSPPVMIHVRRPSPLAAAGD